MQRKGRWWRLGRRVINGGRSGALAVGRAGDHFPWRQEERREDVLLWVNLEVEKDEI